MRNGEVPRREEAVQKMCWKNRSKLARRLIIAAVIFTGLLAFILFIYLLLPNEPLVCSSLSCKHISRDLLLDYLDPKVDPCEDFYRFTCGNFLQNSDHRGFRSARLVAEDETRDRMKNMLEEPLLSEDPAGFNLPKKFYRACTNQTAINAEEFNGTEGIFRQIGGWPILEGDNWREDGFDWKEAMYKLREIGINFEFFLIFSVEVYTARDYPDRSRYILNLKDPFGRSSEISEDVKRFYLDYMADLAVLLGANETRARKEQHEVVKFIFELAKISEEALASNDTTKDNNNYNLFSLPELQKEVPEINWYKLLPKTFHPIPFSFDYEINVNCKSQRYIRKLLQLLQRTRKRTVANFVCWHILQQLINYLPDRILNRAYDYIHNLDRNTTRLPRWRICLDDVEKRMYPLVSTAYVEKYLDEETRSRVISMIQNIKHQFIENLDELDWLDEKTKDIARGILVSSVEDIPSFDNLVKRNRFYDQIKNVELSEDNLLASVLNLDYAAANIRFEKLRYNVSENFFENPGSVTGLNIVYSPEKNVLRIPVGLFHGIFFQTSRPEYMNYGALGTVIAHEIYHIMTEAKYRYSQEKLTGRWSLLSLFNYTQKLNCLDSSYGKYIVSKIEQHANGSNTRDEVMADLAGMKVAYDAYSTWMQANGAEPQLPNLNCSSRMTFWVAASLPHCVKGRKYVTDRHPERYRVNGALQNLEEFAKDFGCAPGTGMNPENKCRIW